MKHVGRMKNVDEKLLLKKARIQKKSEIQKTYFHVIHLRFKKALFWAVFRFIKIK